MGVGTNRWQSSLLDAMFLHLRRGAFPISGPVCPHGWFSFGFLPESSSRDFRVGAA